MYSTRSYFKLLQYLNCSKQNLLFYYICFWFTCTNYNITTIFHLFQLKITSLFLCSYYKTAVPTSHVQVPNLLAFSILVSCKNILKTNIDNICILPVPLPNYCIISTLSTKNYLCISPVPGKKLMLYFTFSNWKFMFEIHLFLLQNYYCNPLFNQNLHLGSTCSCYKINTILHLFQLQNYCYTSPIPNKKLLLYFSDSVTKQIRTSTVFALKLLSYSIFVPCKNRLHQQVSSKKISFLHLLLGQFEPKILRNSQD